MSQNEEYDEEENDSDEDESDEEADEDDDDSDEDEVDEEADEDDDDEEEADEEVDEEDDETDVDDDPVDFEENKVFVIMRFSGNESQEVFSAIKDECSKLGLTAEIASEIAGSGLVIQDIRDSIEQAEFIICDLTGERPNIYYELGHAHGLGNDALRILLIAKDETPLHFDVAPFRARFYKSTEHLRGIVSSELDRMMRLTR